MNLFDPLPSDILAPTLLWRHFGLTPLSLGLKQCCGYPDPDFPHPGSGSRYFPIPDPGSATLISYTILEKPKKMKI